jgi:ABC-2 type transport system permease protein
MSWSAVQAVAAKDISQRIRDRSALLNGVVAPLVLTVLMSLAFGRGDNGFQATMALVDLDRGPVAATFADVLTSKDLSDVIDVEQSPNRADAVSRLADGDVDAAIIITAGLGTALDEGGTGRIEVLQANRAPVAGAVAESLVRSFAGDLDAVRRSVTTARAAGATGSVEELTAAARALAAADAVVERTTRRPDVSAASTFAPAMAVFFLYFVVALGVRSVIAERTVGTFTRLLAAPVPGRAVLGGKVAATFLLGLVSMAVLVVTSTFLLSASWGPPVAVAAVVLAITAAATAIGACVITLARTQRQAEAAMSVITFAFALLGGNFINVSQSPVLVQRIALVTPNGWALRAFADLLDGGSWRVVVGPVAAMAAFAVVAGTVAVTRAGRVLRP